MMNLLKGLVVRIGRRGSFLLFLALLDLIYGYSLVAAVSPASLLPDMGATPLAWGIAWLFVGVVCFVEAFLTVDRLAFTLAVLLKFLWGTAMLASWMLTTTNPHGWLSAAIWLAFAGVTSIISYWPEQRRFKIEDL